MALTTTRVLAWAIGALFVAGAATVLIRMDWSSPTPPPPVIATTQPTPTTLPATVPALAPPTSFLDVVRRTDPRFDGVEPLGIPLNQKEAARLVIQDRLYVSPDLRLWTIRDDGQPIQEILQKLDDVPTPVTRDPIVYLQWQLQDDGTYSPIAICQTPDGDHEAVDPLNRWPLPAANYRWKRAFSWNGHIVVPTDTGVFTFQFGPELSKGYADFGDAAKGNEVQILVDAQGLLAWMPWEDGKPGSKGALRLTNGGPWTRLDASNDWPEKIVHLVPLLDGSVLRLARDEQGKVVPSLATLVAAEVDEREIEDLVWQLSDPMEEKRVEAFNELTRYGPGLWPILEKLVADQPAETQVRLRQLLANKIQPSLGGMSLVDGELQTVARLDDGGVVFYSASGVMVSDGRGGPARPETPAWISIRPGRAIQLLSPHLTTDLEPGQDQLITLRNEWIVLDDVLGPQRFMGNHLAPLLKKSERNFQFPVAVDQRGRWLFSESEKGLPPTLVIDPTLPDPRPRLPVWKFSQAEEVGWTEAGWPVTKRGGMWVLEADGWRPLNDKTETMLSEVPDEPTAPLAPTTSATTQATTQPAEPAEPALLIAPDGTRYFGGLSELLVIDPSGDRTVWPLPGEASGSIDRPRLFRIADGTLFLFNEPGRIVRIKPIAGGPEPFRVERIFTRNLPNVEPRRIWMDPAERILIAHGTGHLTILFPSGRVPPKIQTLMPADDELDETEE